MKKMDEGHKETDELLEKLERRISQEYSQAAKEMQEKARAHFDKFNEQDKEMRAKLDAGKITKKSYQAWRRGNMLMDKQYKAMCDVLAKDCTNANKIAMNMVYDNMKDAYAINANYGAFQVEKGSQMNTSFTLYDRKTVERLIRDDPDLLPKPRVDIPKDLRWNRSKINSALLQGVLQGDSIPQIAARLQSVTGMLERAAVRNARTMTTGAECKGRIDSYKRAEAMGIKMKKMWVATLDGRTRHEHRLLDGQQTEVNKPFEIDGYKLDCPGDPAGEPEMVYNCRCTVIAVIPETRLDKEGIGILERDGKYEGMSYEEWKHEKERKPEKAMIGADGGKYTQAQRSEMQALLDSAPEPIRKVWQKFQGAFYETEMPDSARGSDSAYFDPKTGRVYLDPNKVANSSHNVPYETHFHEFGHNIDYISVSGNNFHDKWSENDHASVQYRNKNGKTFEEIITEEWGKKFKTSPQDYDRYLLSLNMDPSRGGRGAYSYVNSRLNEWRNAAGLNRRDEKYIALRDELRLIQDNDDEVVRFFEKHINLFPQLETDDYYEKNVVRERLNDYCNAIIDKYSLNARSDLSDMLERFSVNHGGGDYPLGVGHGEYYAKLDGRLAMETFAEMFSASISNQESLALIKSELPESYAAFEEILRGIL